MPEPDLLELAGPIDDIEQGRIYGETLDEAYAVNEADREKHEVWERYCDQLQSAAETRETKKAEMRDALIEALKNEKRPLRFRWPF